VFDAILKKTIAPAKIRENLVDNGLILKKCLQKLFEALKTFFFVFRVHE
jgi:hypothetical protein